MSKFKYLFFIFVLVLFSICIIQAEEMDVKKIFGMRTGLGANDLGNMAWDGKNVWVEGSGALTKLVGDGRKVTDWISYTDIEGFGRGSISALWASGDTLIASWGYSDMYNGSLTPFGDGISVSLDGGQNWRHVTVATMFPDRADWKETRGVDPGLTTTIWDITVSKGVLWCSTTAGFLLKSSNMGLTWTQLLPDSTFSYGNKNHHGQCVDVYGDTVWVGTFMGMNLSTDKGKTWKNFSWPTDGTADISNPFPGNFPVAAEHKTVGGKTYLWVASQPYFGEGQYGVCYTSDNGDTWVYKKMLDLDSRPWNIDFGHSGANDPAISDSTVFVATETGLLVSYDLGTNWTKLPVKESDNLSWEPDISISSVMVVGDTLWVTSTDGVARTTAYIDTLSSNGVAVIDTTSWGEKWEIFKGVARVRTLDTGNRNIGISSEYDYQNDNIKTYAFPNPFSPKRQTQSYSRTRIQFALEKDANVSISIFNFSGRLIRDLITDENRSGGRDYQEVWDGKDAGNNYVPNGVYFYKIKTNMGDSAFGKIMVLD